MPMTKTLLAVLAALPLTACVGDSADDQSADISALSQAVQQDVLAARAATEAFHSFEAAEAAGYVNTGLPCIEGMGYHYIRPDLLGTFDVTQPHVLMFHPNADGELRFVGLEWLQPIEDETTTPTTLFGQTFHGPNMLDGVPFAFFALHAWIWQANPAGMFEGANPNISCP